MSWARDDGQESGAIRITAEDGGIRLRYATFRPGEEPEPTRSLIRVVYTSPHLGGRRPWFECPWCWRRCATLYGGLKVREFRCRVCHDLTYHTQHVDASGRIQARMRKLRKRLGGSDDLFVDPFPDKPCGMHWSTYDRLQAQDDKLQQAMDWYLDRRMIRGLESLERRVRRLKALHRSSKPRRR